MKHFIYVVNWKMYLSFAQARQWIIQHKQTLAALATHHTIVLCPSFDALFTIGQTIQDTPVALGAQNCSEHEAGAYTGQVSAHSLQEIGCAYCIIGHSEVSNACKETADQIAQKAISLLQNNIVPIICVGETALDYDTNRGRQALEEQLSRILLPLAQKENTLNTIALAYEPQWIINTTTHLPAAYLDQQLETIHALTRTLIPHYKTLLLYGGGVNEITIGQFKNHARLQGVLIGRASTNFQTFEKIVLSY